eukprot:9445009-Pyramimonas_sp.AAC.1
MTNNDSICHLQFIGKINAKGAAKYLCTLREKRDGKVPEDAAASAVMPSWAPWVPPQTAAAAAPSTLTPPSEETAPAPATPMDQRSGRSKKSLSNIPT